MDRIAVLIADDHPVMREGLRMVIDRSGVAKVVAELVNGADLLDAIASSGCDVVLLDVMMPGTGGVAALATLATAGNRVPIIVISGSDDTKLVRQVLCLGASAFIHKHTPADKLIHTVQAVHSGERGIVHDSSSRPPVAPRRSRAKVVTRDKQTAFSPREVQVLTLVAEGHTSKEIAAMLEVSVKTVEGYRARVKAKLGATSRVDLQRKARDLGLSE